MIVVDSGVVSCRVLVRSRVLIVRFDVILVVALFASRLASESVEEVDEIVSGNAIAIAIGNAIGIAIDITIDIDIHWESNIYRHRSRHVFPWTVAPPSLLTCFTSHGDCDAVFWL